MVLETVKIRSQKELVDYRKSIGNTRLDFEKHMAEEHAKDKEWYLSGFCEPCSKQTKFLIDWKYSDGVTPNYRERLVCEYCGLNNRQRFIAGFLNKLIKEKGNSIQDIYMYEQITNFYSYVKANYGKLNVVGSEYLGYDKKPSVVINNIRHEDALNLSFSDESFDIVISNDVYEHVSDISKTLSEAYRVLKKNGVLLISIPFHMREEMTKKRAVLVNGGIQHLLPEQYHGNPLSEKGSLVFYDYGWDFLHFCKSAGFGDTYMLAYYGYPYGYIGGGLLPIFIAER